MRKKYLFNLAEQTEIKLALGARRQELESRIESWLRTPDNHPDRKSMLSCTRLRLHAVMTASKEMIWHDKPE